MRLIVRFSSRSAGGLPRASGTTILLEHCGLPRTPFYATQHLQGLIGNVGIPTKISSQLAALQYRFSPKIQSALAGTGDYLPLTEAFKRFGNELSRKLDFVLPEFAPFNTRAGFLFDQPSIEEAVQGIIEDGTDRLVVISAYPFGLPHFVRSMERTTQEILKSRTATVCDPKSGRRSFVATNRPVSFDFNFLSNIGSHDSFVQYWADRLANNLGEFDSIIFALPAPPLAVWTSYSTALNAAAQRVIYRLYRTFPRAVPYRVAFYSSWHQICPPSSILNSIKRQAGLLRKFERKSPLVVPFGSLFKDFDSEFVLQRIVDEQIQDGRLLQPEEGDSALSHSFVELLKTNLLTAEAKTVEFSGDPLF